MLLSVAILLLCLLLSTGCSQRPLIVVNEAKTLKLMQGESAPWDGWLLTDGALVTLLEEVKRCQK